MALSNSLNLNYGTAGQILTGNGTTSLPTFQTVPGGIQAWPYVNFTDPTVGPSWSWVNQGPATITTTAAASGQNVLSLADASGTASDNQRIRITPIATAPYTLDAIFTWVTVPTAGNNSLGICLYDSGTTKSVAFVYQIDGFYRIYKYNNPNSTSSVSQVTGILGNLLFFRIVDNGTNRIFSYSTDGITFTSMFSEGNTVFCTPDNFGFMVNNGGSSFIGMTLASWKVT